MKRTSFLLLAIASGFGCGAQPASSAAQATDARPPVYTGATAAPTPIVPEPAAVVPAPPPSASPRRSAADLEKLVGPLALYPDPLIATMLPASVYPLEIVQAARFVADTNNLARLDAQPWDQSVKAVARVPDAIKKMNDDLAWTIELGEAFLAQDKDVMDAIQNLRGKAQKAGTLQTTPQQVVVVTNMIVVQTNATQVVTVTNQIVQIQPANPSVVYVPTYNPTTVYYPPPAYVYDPLVPLVTFTAGVAMGAIIANNCDWYHGGCYHGDVDIDVDRNVNRNVDRNTDRTGSRNTDRAGSTAQKKWQPDQSRLRTSGSSGATASTRAEARGWSSSGARPSAQPATAARPATTPGSAGARPSTGPSAARPSVGTPSASRPSASQGASRPSPSAGASPGPSASSYNRPSSSGSAFGGMSSGSGARNYSSRGASSRGGGFGGGGGRGGRR